MNDKKGVDLDGRANVKNLGRVERGEIIIRIYYVRKKYFQLKENFKKNYVWFSLSIIHLFSKCLSIFYCTKRSSDI